MVKYALISGGTGGIGNALCASFAKRGYKVIATAPKSYEGELKKLEAELGAITRVCDISDVDDIKSLRDYVASITDELAVCYCNAGIPLGTSAIDFDDAQMEKLFRVNLIGHIYTTKYMADFIIKGKGAYVFTSSVAASVPLNWCSLYSASKAGIDTYARTLRDEMAPFGVRVYSVITGGVNTPKSTRVQDSDKAWADQLVTKSHFNVPGYVTSLKAAGAMTKGTTEPNVYAEQVVSCVDRQVSQFNLYKGRRAFFLHFIARYLPINFVTRSLGKAFKTQEMVANLKKKYNVA
ncbi:NADPH-dependent 1-acyldihydroxyacetone phosphate reductase [Diutina catenulata]